MKKEITIAKIKLILIGVGWILAMLLLFNYNKDRYENINNCPDYTLFYGSVTNITKDGELGSVLVENGSDKIVFRIDENTKILIDNSLASINDILLNSDIIIEHSGQLAESYPMQGTAYKIYLRLIEKE